MLRSLISFVDQLLSPPSTRGWRDVGCVVLVRQEEAYDGAAIVLAKLEGHALPSIAGQQLNERNAERYPPVALNRRCDDLQHIDCRKYWKKQSSQGGIFKALSLLVLVGPCWSFLCCHCLLSISVTSTKCPLHQRHAQIAGPSISTGAPRRKA